MLTLFTLVAIGLAANVLHGAWVGVRLMLWERHHTRGTDGLLPHASAFSLGSGPVALLMVHGFADTPHLWTRIAERLAGTGTFTCRAMRLPGSGEPLAQAKRQSLALWRQAVDGELDALRASHRSVWIVGHSLGGALALDAALRHPDTVAGVAAFAPMIEISRRRSPLLPPAVWFRFASVLLALSPVFESCFSSENQAADDPAFTYTKDRFVPFCVYRSLFQLIRDNRSRAGRLTCSLFGATADLDSVVDSSAALRWFGQCAGPKRVRALPDIRHVIPLENGWQELTDDLAEFIRSHPNSKTVPDGPPR